MINRPAIYSESAVNSLPTVVSGPTRLPCPLAISERLRPTALRIRHRNRASISYELDIFTIVMLPSLKDAAVPAAAADDHTHRLDRIDTRLERIEERLDLTHA